MFSTQTIGIAIAGVATASFAAGFIGADQALKQPVVKVAQTAQPLQPKLSDTAQSVLWYSDNGLNHVNRQVQLARRQSEFASKSASESAIAQSSYPNRRIPHQTDAYESYANQASWSIFDHHAESAPSQSVSPVQSPVAPINESAATVDPYFGATDDTPANTSTESIESAEPSASPIRSTDYRSDNGSDSRSLKPNFGWPGSPDFVEDYIKAGAK